MKEYMYVGDLQEDLKIINKKIDFKQFLKRMSFQLLGLIVFCSLFYFTGVIDSVLVFSVSYLSSASTLSFLSERSKAKTNSALATFKVVNLYEQVFSDLPLDDNYIKDCISISKKEKVVEDTETLNIVLSGEEKLVNYFYLLSPDKKIKVLRQIKDELMHSVSNVYLLEEEDIEQENIEIPEHVVKKIKK